MASKQPPTRIPPKPLAVKVADTETERAISHVRTALETVTANPLMNCAWLWDVELPDGVTTLVPHNFTKVRSFEYFDVRGETATGRIIHWTEGVDESKHLGLRASGFGTTIKVNLRIYG